MDARTILAIGTGVGLQIAEQDLHVTVARVRPNGIKILGSTVIAGFRHRPASEWGAEYAEFLRRLGAGYLAAHVLLPRAEVIVRQVALPGVASRDLASAIQYQLESLHPYGEDEAQCAWAPVAGTSAVLIGITRKTTVDQYSRMFIEAGIKVAAFSFSAAVIYSAVRILSVPPGGFLAIAGEDGGFEMYGESPARSVFSAVPDSSADRAVALAAAELRLPSETQPVRLAEILPKPRSCPADYDPERAALPYATALAGACPRLGLNANLLPPELRSTSSRMIFVPTIGLAAILLLLVAALGAQTAFEQRRELTVLQQQIARFEPQASKANAAERAAELARNRIELLDGFRRRTRDDLETLNELTRLISPPAWVNGLDMNRESVVVSGQIDQAAPLLKLLDSSPYFKSSEFAGPIGKAGKNDVFRVRAAREGVGP